MAENNFNQWWKWAATIKRSFISIYQRNLPKTAADLLSGIVLGGRGIDVSMKNKLASVGLSHVIAASGMNVSFVAGIVFFILQPLRLKKIYKVIFAITMIFFYSTITGFDPPIVRALIMSVLVTIAGLLGRSSSMAKSLSITAFIMLWVSPELVTSASFLLSFAATTAQVFLSSLKLPVPNVIAPVIEIFLQSFLASVFTLPLILIFFTKFSLISFFINPVVLWTVEPLMILGFLAGIGLTFFLLPASVLLNFFLKMVDIAAQIPNLNVNYVFSSTAFALFFTSGYYLLLISVMIYVHERQSSG